MTRINFLNSCQTHEASERRRWAFTLVEVIVVVLVVSTLTSVALVFLSRSRGAAREARVLATLGQHARVLAVYRQDFSGAYPQPFPARAGDQDLVLPTLGFSGTLRYLDTCEIWRLALAPAYFDGQIDGLQPSGDYAFGVNPYIYPLAFLAKPEYWNLKTRTGTEQLGGCSEAAVVFPSLKVVVFDAWSAQGGVRVDPSRLCAATCDGRAHAFPSARREERGPFESACFPDYSSFPPRVGELLNYTLNGVRGRDIK